ncbi:MAG: ImmA/IrrE family metallo-endopeptidase [Solirubrobacterales bacterium]
MGVDVEESERRAAEFLASVPEWIWDGSTLPIPVEEIADTHAGLLVRDVEDMSTAPGCPQPDAGQSISGLLLPSLGEIWVNAEEAREWPARRRFTIAHELGHWVMHQSEQTSLFCRHGSVDDGAQEPQDAHGAKGAKASAKGKRPELPAIEEEANCFAAALLMPAEMVRSEYARAKGDFGALCERFSSSGAAMGRRLHQTV